MHSRAARSVRGRWVARQRRTASTDSMLGRFGGRPRRGLRDRVSSSSDALRPGISARISARLNPSLSSCRICAR